MTTSTATDFVDFYTVLTLDPSWKEDQLRKALKDAFMGNKSRVNAATGEKLELLEQQAKWITQATKILFRS